jgi:hypothetical protein
LLIGLPAASSATTALPLQVSVSTSPTSGGTVEPGATITYTIDARGQDPLPSGATVVDDLSGLLRYARVETPAQPLAKAGLALDTKADRITWTVPALGQAGPSSATATTSFQVVVAAGTPAGTRLTTAAFPTGGSCSSGKPCATTLTVAGGPTATSSTTTPFSAPAPAPKPRLPTVTASTTAPIPSPAAGARASALSPAADPPAACTQPQAPNSTVVAGFEIDGNLCTNTPGNLDWDNVGGQPVQIDGFADSTQFTQGASEANWPWSNGQITGVNSAPAADDIGNVYAFDQISGTQVFAYFGFQRRSGTGSVAYYVELNQKPNRVVGTPGANGPVPDRTTGDLRLTFYQGGNSPISLVNAATWSAGSTANAGSWVSLPSLAGFSGATNQLAGVTDLSGASLPIYTFAEVAINLTALFPGDSGLCSGTYGYTNLRSASSPSANSSLGDWISPVALDVPSTCASLRVNKAWNIDGTTFANGSQPPGFAASLSLTGRTNPQFGVTYGQRSDGAPYLAGQSVTVGESVTLPAGCTSSPTGDIGDHSLAPGLNTFQITNVVTCSRLTLQKQVVGGVAIPVNWTLTAKGPTPGISGPSGSAAVTRVRVTPGTYTLSESAGPSDYRQTSLTCTGGVLAGSTVTVALHDNVICTFTNTAIHPVVLTKTWQNAIPGDTVSLSIRDGANIGTPGSSTAGGTTTDATLTGLAGDTISLTETFTTGTAANYTSALACDNGVTPAPATGPSGSFVVPSALTAGTTITCTFTNTRNQAELILQKTWVNGATGDSADLSITGTDPATGAASTSTATSVSIGAAGPFPDLRNRAEAPIFAGETVTVSEILGALNIGTYTSALACNDGTTASGTSGTVAVPSTPVDVVCIFTNTRTSATVTVLKDWVNGATGDQAGLSITGTDPATSGSAIANVPFGGTGTASETATATIFSGETVSINEQLPPPGHVNTGAYTSSITCTPSTGFTPGSGGRGGTLEVPSPPVHVTCTFTNTRATTGILTLQKSWVNGEQDDTADLLVSATLASGSTTATVPVGGTGISADTVQVPLTANESVTLGEILRAANSGSYTSSLSCDQPGLTGNTFAVSSGTEAVLCTFTNTRTSANLTLEKAWVNGAAGDSAGLSIIGTDPTTVGAAIATVPVGGTGTSSQSATAPIYSGQTVTVSETLAPGNTGTYTSSLDCSNGITATETTTGTFTIPATPVPVTCAFTNIRTSDTLTLEKAWVNGAATDTADLSITGTDPATSGTATATVPVGGTGTSSQSATAPIYSGQTVTVSERLAPGNTGTYTSSLDCSNGITATETTTGTFTIPAAPVPVTCTFTNTRTEATLELVKDWVNGATDDAAVLSITGTDPATSDTATATVPAGANGLSSQFASAPIYSGQTVALSEALAPGNTGTYTSRLDCSNGISETGTSGTITIPAAPVPVTCTFTNTRTEATLELVKAWVNGAAGDTAALSIIGTDPATSGGADAAAVGGTGPSSETATAPIYSGQTVSVSETLGSDNTGTYTSRLDCDNGVTDTDTITGTLIIGAAPVPITCTFTNTRTEATLELVKAWVNGAAGDTAGLSIIGTDLSTEEAASSTVIATVPAGGTGSSSETATAPIFSGETVTMNEDLPAEGESNTGAYTSDITCAPSGGFTPGTGGQGGTLDVPSQPVDVTCTITNTRATTGVLTLQKDWVNGFPGDTAVLSVGGALGTETATAVAPADGTGTSVDKVVQAPITANEVVNLGESLDSANQGTYVSTLSCDQPGLVPSADGRSGSFTVTADLTAVTCTFTNSGDPPSPTVTKTVTSNTQNPDGTWTTVYDVAVTNPDPLRPTAFSLTDTLAFGANIVIHSATVTGTGASPSWNGTTNTTVLTDAPLGPGVTEHYTVAVNATVMAEASAADRLCAAGGGFHNTAGVALPTPSADQEASACADPASPTISKKVVSVVAGPTLGQWIVTYDVTVTNATDTQLAYSLHDELGFPAGITITSTAASRVHSALNGGGASASQVIPGWTGSGSGTVLAANRPIAAQSKDTYTVVVGATVPVGLAAGTMACSSAGTGHGYFNSATLTSGLDQFNAEACDPIMPTATPPPGVPPASPSAPSAPSGTLAFTGLILSRYVGTAVALLGVGAALVVGGRRRRSSRRHPSHKA